MIALVLLALTLTACGGDSEPYKAPDAFSEQVCELHCTTLCTKMVACLVDAGRVEAYAAPLARQQCYQGCGVGLTTVIYDRQLDSAGLFAYCDANRQDTPLQTCEQMIGDRT